MFAIGVVLERHVDFKPLQRDTGLRAAKLLQRGTSPVEYGWGGWLGRYQAALRKAAAELAQQPELVDQTFKPRQGRDRSVER